MVVFTIITGKIQRIRQEKENGAIYVYDRTPYYDPATRNTKYHYAYVGKESGGEVRKVRSVLPRRSLMYGPFVPLMDIVKAYGLRDLLERYLTLSESNAILSLAIGKIVRPLPMRSLGSWYEGTHLSKALPADLSSQSVSRLMEKIGESSLHRDFSMDLIGKMRPSGSLFYEHHNNRVIFTHTPL